MPTAPRPVGIAFDCTTCGYVLRAAPDQTGRIVVCPACEARLIVPTEPDTPVEPVRPFPSMFPSALPLRPRA